jgi:hypothetical protein
VQNAWLTFGIRHLTCRAVLLSPAARQSEWLH